MAVLKVYTIDAQDKAEKERDEARAEVSRLHACLKNAEEENHRFAELIGELIGEKEAAEAALTEARMQAFAECIEIAERKAKDWKGDTNVIGAIIAQSIRRRSREEG